jgi:hypothetical protein
MDDDTPANRAFDAEVNSYMDQKWDRPMWSQASPDGLGPGRGLWRVYHNCANPVLGPWEDGRISCKGCGQSFAYEATRGGK